MPKVSELPSATALASDDLVYVVADGISSKTTLRNVSPISVTWFGADPTGVADSTAAFNLATRAATAHGGNDDLSMRRDIYVPPGDYLIAGTVYVRKGQRLFGAGDGASRIVVPVASAGTITFHLGYGVPSAILTADAGGLPPIIELLHTYGGDTSGPIVEVGVAGSQVRDMFITSCGIGINIVGGDVIVTRCIIDQGLNGIVITGQNHIVNACIFYNMNYGIRIAASCFDTQIGNCHFEYGEYDDILFDNAAENIRNVAISDCQFLKNVQYATATASINIRSNSAEININDCEFRNHKGYAIARTNGIGNVVRVADCIFDGNKTNPAYAQSTTAAGVDTTNCNFEIANCTFRNLPGAGIVAAHASDYPVVVHNCAYENVQTGTSFVQLTGSTGSAVLRGNIGDNVLPLFNSQSAMNVRANHNVDWLGASAVLSTRRYWNIPVQGAAALQVGIAANSNVGGNSNYRKVSSVIAARHIDFDTVVTEYATKTTLYEAPTGSAPLLDVQVDLNTLGGGASAAYASQAGTLVVSVPDAYVSISINADYLS